MQFQRVLLEDPMTNSEYKRRLHHVVFTCGINHRYHHTLEWVWGAVDKGIRVGVGVLAIVGLVLAVPSFVDSMVGFYVAIASVVVALALNIVPVGDWEKFHGEM